jgi:nucleotide-binding universal stress UspA family protein
VRSLVRQTGGFEGLDGRPERLNATNAAIFKVEELKHGVVNREATHTAREDRAPSHQNTVLPDSLNSVNLDVPVIPGFEEPLHKAADTPDAALGPAPEKLGRVGPLEVRVMVGLPFLPVAVVERLEDLANDLHVLLRHIPRSITRSGAAFRSKRLSRRALVVVVPTDVARLALMQIELLYFEGCPSYQELLPTLREVLADEGIKHKVELRRVETPEEAEREHFLGSPTVRINGEDIDPNAKEREDFGIECRLYRIDDGLVRTPPEEWIRSAIGRAR